MSDHPAAFPPAPGPAAGNGTIPITGAPMTALGKRLTLSIGSGNVYGCTVGVTGTNRWNQR